MHRATAWLLGAIIGCAGSAQPSAPLAEEFTLVLTAKHNAHQQGGLRETVPVLLPSVRALVIDTSQIDMTPCMEGLGKPVSVGFMLKSGAVYRLSVEPERQLYEFSPDTLAPYRGKHGTIPFVGLLRGEAGLIQIAPEDFRADSPPIEPACRLWLGSFVVL